MNLEININTLKTVVEKAVRATGKNLSLPVLSCLFLDVNKEDGILTIKSTNLDIGSEFKIKVKCIDSGSVAVPAQTFLNFISSISFDGDLKIIQKQENLSLYVNKNTSTIKCFSKEDFPEIPTVIVDKKCLISVKDFLNGLKSVWFAASVSSIKPELASVYIYSGNQELVFVATDSFRLAEKKISFKNPNDFQSVLIPYKNIPDIIKMLDGISTDIELTFDKNQLQIETSNVKIISRVIDATFPDYKQIIPKMVQTEAVILKDELLKAIRRAQVFTDNFNQVRFSFKNKENSVFISAKNNDVGDYNESIQAKITGDDLELSFNYKYVLDSFQSINSESLHLSLAGAGKPMIISGSGDKSFTYIAMPMNR